MCVTHRQLVHEVVGVSMKLVYQVCILPMDHTAASSNVANRRHAEQRHTPAEALKQKRVGYSMLCCRMQSPSCMKPAVETGSSQVTSCAVSEGRLQCGRLIVRVRLANTRRGKMINTGCHRPSHVEACRVWCQSDSCVRTRVMALDLYR